MKTFKPDNPEKLYLLPPAPRDSFPEGHLALFISDGVDTQDLEPILSVYEQADGRGAAAVSSGDDDEDQVRQAITKLRMTWIAILLKNLPFILREPQDERRSV